VWAWVEPEAGWGTGVNVMQGYVVVLLSVGVDEDYTPSGFFKDVTFRERVFASLSSLVVTSFLLPYC